MEIISSERSTTLSGFPDFKTKFIYRHANNEANDFQFFGKKRLFIEVNKKSGLEFLRILRPTPINNDTNNDIATSNSISRVRKMRIENLFCVGCPKQGHDEIALGLSTGQIKLLDYKTTTLTSKFVAENARHSVVSLDFNASDEYLSSVYENGTINIYGIKTKTKLETLNVDFSSTLARFHPTKKFHLSVASFKGAVFIYDIHAKRTVYQCRDAHTAPCRDICLSPNQPNTLLSVGYDCCISIHDTRKSLTPKSIKCEHPLSCITISDCGNFCCAGNLKGELIAYDLRNLKSTLEIQKLYETAVVRVAFVPKEVVNDRQSSLFTTATSNHTALEAIPENKTNPNIGIIPQKHSKRDSFCDFIDYHTLKNKDDKLTGRLFSRESFDWSSLNPKHKFDTSSENIFTTAVQKLVTDDSSNLSDGSSSKKENIKPISSGNINTSTDEYLVSQNNSLNLSNRKRLSDVKETDTDIDKELNLIKMQNNSTPNQNYGNRLTSSIINNNNTTSTINIQPDIIKQLAEMRTDFDQKFNAMKLDLGERIHALENEIKFNAECNKWQLLTQNFNLWNKQNDFNIDIKGSVDCLILTDDFYQEFVRIKQENEQLKNQLSQLSNSK